MDRKKAAFFTVALVIILAMIHWVGAKGIVEILLHASLLYFLAAIAVYALTLLSAALRWRTLLKPLGVNASVMDVLNSVFVGMFFNNVSPGAKGLGEFVRVYYLSKKTDSPYGPVTASVMMDRILDLIPIGVMMVFATLYVYNLGETALTLLIAFLDAVLIAFSALVVGLLMSEKRAHSAIWWIYRQYSKLSKAGAEKRHGSFEKIDKVTIPRFQMDFKNLITNRSSTAIAVAWSFVYWGLTIARYYLVFMTIHYPISPSEITVVLIVSMVVGMFAVIPGGAGIIEAVNSAVFIALGIDPDYAVTGTILERLISYWGPTIMGSFVVADFDPKKEKLPEALPEELPEMEG